MGNIGCVRLNPDVTLTTTGIECAFNIHRGFPAPGEYNSAYYMEQDRLEVIVHWSNKRNCDRIVSELGAGPPFLGVTCISTCPSEAWAVIGPRGIVWSNP